MKIAGPGMSVPPPTYNPSVSPGPSEGFEAEPDIEAPLNDREVAFVAEIQKQSNALFESNRQLEAIRQVLNVPVDASHDLTMEAIRKLREKLSAARRRQRSGAVGMRRFPG